MKKEEKKVLVKELSKELEGAKSVFLVNYTGMKVTSQQELKKRLKAVDARIVVVKNTLLKIAGSEAGIPEESLTDEVLAGQTALVLGSGDPISPVQVVGKFAKEFEIPKFKVGIIEGLFQDNLGLTKISVLPSKDVLYSQLLGSLLGASYGLVSVLESNMQQLVYVLQEAQAKADK